MFPNIGNLFQNGGFQNNFSFALHPCKTQKLDYRETFFIVLEQKRLLCGKVGHIKHKQAARYGLLVCAIFVSGYPVRHQVSSSNNASSWRFSCCTAAASNLSTVRSFLFYIGVCHLIQQQLNKQVHNNLVFKKIGRAGAADAGQRDHLVYIAGKRQMRVHRH